MKPLHNTQMRCMTVAVLMGLLLLVSCKDGAKRQENKDGASVQNAANTSKSGEKLLESIVDDDGESLEFEYDDKKRLVKINGETITYADNHITVGDAKYSIKGTKISVGESSFTIDGDGRIVGEEGAVYEYDGANLVKIEWTESGYESGYEYDDKPSPFSNSKTPKWLLQRLLREYAGSNNIVRLIGEGFVYAYEYEYDDDGFPKSRIRHTVESVDGDDGRNHTVRYNYIGEERNVSGGDESAETAVITVSNVREFVAALGDNVIIELKPGRYDLSERIDPDFEGEDNSPPGVSWSYGDGSLRLSDIHNLTIRGIKGGKSGKLPEIVIAEPMAYVIAFDDCSDITIEDISAGHSSGGYCTGGVFSFVNSSDININGAQMYGSGMEGLTLGGVSDMKVTNSRIYECTYYIMSVENSKNLVFENCSFDKNREYDLINVGNTKKMSFADCKFENNVGSKMFSVGEEASVIVRRSSFNGNETETATEGSPNVTFIDCKFDKAEKARYARMKAEEAALAEEEAKALQRAIEEAAAAAQEDRKRRAEAGD